MKRAVELFTFERRSSPSPFVDETWQTRSEPEASFISVAATHWEIVVTRHRDAARLTVRGPETKATIVPIPQDAEFFGIEFRLGTFMPTLPPRQLVDRSLELPLVSPNSFWLDGSAWELPGTTTPTSSSTGSPAPGCSSTTRSRAGRPEMVTSPACPVARSSGECRGRRG